MLLSDTTQLFVRVQKTDVYIASRFALRTLYVYLYACVCGGEDGYRWCDVGAAPLVFLFSQQQQQGHLLSVFFCVCAFCARCYQ